MRSPRRLRGIASATFPAQVASPSGRAATRGSPATIVAAATPPPSTMPTGEVIALATGAVKNRSRNEDPAIGVDQGRPPRRAVDAWGWGTRGKGRAVARPSLATTSWVDGGRSGLGARPGDRDRLSLSAPLHVERHRAAERRLERIGRGHDELMRHVG